LARQPRVRPALAMLGENQSHRQRFGDRRMLIGAGPLSRFSTVRILPNNRSLISCRRPPGVRTGQQGRGRADPARVHHDRGPGAADRPLRFVYGEGEPIWPSRCSGPASGPGTSGCSCSTMPTRPRPSPAPCTARASLPPVGRNQGDPAGHARPAQDDHPARRASRPQPTRGRPTPQGLKDTGRVTARRRGRWCCTGGPRPPRLSCDAARGHLVGGARPADHPARRTLHSASAFARERIVACPPRSRHDPCPAIALGKRRRRPRGEG
jgi:hypothetical protein